ncbi:MAG TPA: nitrate/nitrite transporter [Alphaproteobacteria bacterium]|nr:nitrate/nitrite transporter [Alphaproteobacteria bacterium]
MRNLLLSMPALLLSFTVWMVWSVVVIELPKIGFRFTTGELFWLAAAPGISGVGFRLLYSFVVPLFGGRNWTIFSTASLLIPTLWMAFAVQDPGTDYSVFVVIALLCGLGGGNFASSMANISFFFPKRLQGTALGWNAGVGNLGVGIVQGVVPLVIYGGALSIMGGDAETYVGGDGSGEIWLQNAGFIWVPFILLATLAAAWGQNNIRTVRATIGRQIVIYRRKHAWLLAWLYAGTFGSFIGFSAAFPILLATLFPGQGMISWAFIGPLAGALVRPLGGWLSDRLGGARVTLWNFAAMVAAAFGVLMFLPSTVGATGVAGAAGGNELPWFFAAFMALFITTGIGNGAVFHVVPAVFMGLHKRLAEGEDKAAQDAATVAGEIEASVALGFTSAIAALGLFYIPALVAVSMDATGSPQGAMITVVIFYVTCLFATWWWYRRKGAPARCD